MHQQAKSYLVYNVFQHKLRPALRCAVRQDHPLPAFINGEVWSYISASISDKLTSSFESVEATEVARLTGYYLFEVSKEVTTLSDPSDQRKQHEGIPLERLVLCEVRKSVVNHSVAPYDDSLSVVVT